MKKNYIFTGIIALSALGFAMKDSGKIEIEKFNAKAHKNANGAPNAKTGAPGEQNCTDCHSGMAQNGSTENQFVVVDGSFNPVTTYIPGQTYSVSLTMASAPAKKGFQATALTSANVMAGTFTGQGAGGTSVTSGGGRQYANHNSTSNTNTNMVWVWTWTAPATNVGDVTFYVASNKANNNNTSSGDVIYLSQHVMTTTAGIEESNIENNFSAGYNAESNSVKMNFNSLTSGDMTFNLVDVNGKSVFYADLGSAKIGENKESIKLPSDLKNGMYFVNVFVNNTPMSAKIMIQK